MDFVELFLEPDGEFHECERFLLSAEYSQKELLSFGISRNSEDFNTEYLGVHELNKLQKLWSDPLYLRSFYNKHEEYFTKSYWIGLDRKKFVKDVLEWSPHVFKELEQRFKDNTLEELFEPLNDGSIVVGNIDQSKSKYGLIKGHYAFRIYAIKVDVGCYIITGGAIKVVKRMERAKNTKIELEKIDYIYKELEENNVIDIETFIDYIEKD